MLNIKVHANTCQDYQLLLCMQNTKIRAKCKSTRKFQRTCKISKYVPRLPSNKLRAKNQSPYNSLKYQVPILSGINVRGKYKRTCKIPTCQVKIYMLRTKVLSKHKSTYMPRTKVRRKH